MASDTNQQFLKCVLKRINLLIDEKNKRSVTNSPREACLLTMWPCNLRETRWVCFKSWNALV